MTPLAQYCNPAKKDSSTASATRVGPHRSAEVPRPGVLATDDALCFGGGDLVLAGGSLRVGTSALEHSFGVGMRRGSPEARCFLAGSHAFEIADVEVWAIHTGAATGL